MREHMAPVLRCAPCEADLTRCTPRGQSGRAPAILIMDHRGCNRGGANTEYTGPKSGDQDDEMCVKVSNPIVPVRTNQAIAQLRESISFKEKGIDGDYKACLPGSCAMPGRAGRGGK